MNSFEKFTRQKELLIAQIIKFLHEPDVVRERSEAEAQAILRQLEGALTRGIELLERARAERSIPEDRSEEVEELAIMYQAWRQVARQRRQHYAQKQEGKKRDG